MIPFLAGRVPIGMKLITNYRLVLWKKRASVVFKTGQFAYGLQNEGLDFFSDQKKRKEVLWKGKGGEGKGNNNINE